jgi:hypothetical protein
MIIKVGEKVRDKGTKEEGKVVAIYKEAPHCVKVRFGKFVYVVEKEKLEAVAAEPRLVKKLKL